MVMPLNNQPGGLPKGFSNPSPRYNTQTGGYDVGPPVWVGGGTGPGQADIAALQAMQTRMTGQPGTGAFETLAQSNAAKQNPAYGQRVTIGGPNQGVGTPGMQQALGGIAAPTPGTGSFASMQPGARPTQQQSMQAALAANPQALEQYWQQNPQALRSAIGGNPAMFAPTGLQRDGNTAPPTGLIGSEQAMYGGLVGAMGELNAGQTKATDAMTGAAGNASDLIRPYYDEGRGASDYQAALTGALGGQAQADAFQRYQESPEQAYLKEQSERALTRNASATGGLQGGNVLKELQKNATGLAAQDFQNSFNRLETTAGRGYDAGKALSGIELGLGDKLGDLATGNSRAGADMVFGTGQALAGARLGTGKDMANNIGNVTGQLAQIKQQFGGDVANQMQQQTGNLSNLLTGMGLSEQQAQQQIAAMLANIATGSGTQVGGLQGIPGVQETQGMLGGIGQAAAGIGGLATGFGWGV
jgi:hypothetical protein